MKQTNERLCTLAQQGDTAALDSLIENNKSFIGKVANDLFRSMNLAESDAFAAFEQRMVTAVSATSAFRWTMFCRERNNCGALKP